MKTIEINSQYEDQFPIFEPDGINLKIGETSFTTSLALNGDASNVSVSVIESDIPGLYNVSFIPDTLGVWNLLVDVDYNNQKFMDYISSVPPYTTRIFQYNASDNGTTIDIGVWIETDESPILSLDSISVKVHSNDGTEIIDLGTQSTGTSEGVFRFIASSSILNSATSYYLAVTGIQGSNIWTSNLGLTTA